MRELLRDEDQTDVLPGMTIHGQDVGRWLNKQRQHATWTGLKAGQRERLEQLGIMPLAPPAEPETPTETVKAPVGAFERGVAAPCSEPVSEADMTVPDFGNPVLVALDARWEALRERLDASTECAVELVRTAGLLTEECQGLLDENCRLRRRPAGAAEDVGTCQNGDADLAASQPWLSGP